MKAKFLSLQAHDFFKGLIVAVITALLTFLIDALQRGATIDFPLIKQALIAAVIGMLSYLLKNLFTNSHGEFMTKEK